jgi:hypothetical protein
MKQVAINSSNVNLTDLDSDCDEPEADDYTDPEGCTIIDGVVADNAVYFEDGIPMENDSLPAGRKELPLAVEGMSKVSPVGD